MKARRPVSTIRDYRPPSAGATRTTGAPHGATRGGSLPATIERDPDAAGHDAAVRTLSDHALRAAAADLCSRTVWDKRDPEARWVLGRRAALLREGSRRGLASSVS